MNFFVKLNQKSEFIKRCIGEAVVSLMKHTGLEKLKVSDIARKAGVSRTTFYLHYATPDSALADYLKIIIAEYIGETQAAEKTGIFFDYEHILFAFNFFDRYSNYFLTMSKHKLHSVMLDGINQFMLDNIQTDKEVSRYALYSYSGALLNTFIKWEEDGKKENAEEVAGTLAELFGK